MCDTLSLIQELCLSSDRTMASLSLSLPLVQCLAVCEGRHKTPQVLALCALRPAAAFLRPAAQRI